MHMDNDEINRLERELSSFDQEDRSKALHKLIHTLRQNDHEQENVNIPA